MSMFALGLIFLCAQQIKNKNENFSTLTFYTPNQTVTFNTKLAQDLETQKNGLMNKASMPKDEGLLFVFNESKIHKFWMKNTLIPLDIVFMNEEFEVVGVVKNAVPHSLSMLSVDALSKYVFEMNAGLADKYGIKAKVKAVLK